MATIAGQLVLAVKYWEAFWRAVPLVLLATVHIAGFVVAGYFSSHVTTTNSEALIRSSHCGSWPTDMIERSQSNDKSALDTYLAWSMNSRHETWLSFNYARSCYNTTLLSPDCNTYVRRRLDSTVNFAADICLNASSKAIQLGTSFINSHTDLGINAPKDNHITYRRVITCASVETEGFTSSTVGSSPNVFVSDKNNTFLHYGPQLSGRNVATNFTHAYSNWTTIANDGLGGYVLSIFSLAMTLVLGSLILVINLTLESLAGATQKSPPKREYRQLEWGLTETLQLQRLAYEGRDIGTWKGAVNEIPVTGHGESFGLLEKGEAGPSKADSQ
ncbi:MAG: hypothetical protein M1830_002573 [Pleopsidium flavum]|nr:MAG: hypothetical protein M1830_002573 [Pleopsidium flavum]